MISATIIIPEQQLSAPTNELSSTLTPSWIFRKFDSTEENRLRNGKTEPMFWKIDTPFFLWMCTVPY